ncbi:hypothetical protein P7K49_030150, partial [Saguinus oedipus]
IFATKITQFNNPEVYGTPVIKYKHYRIEISQKLYAISIFPSLKGQLICEATVSSTQQQSR